MNRLVVTHHWTAWWRSQLAPSRCTAGRVLRRRSGRGGKRGAGTPTACLLVPLAQLQPDQNAGGQHHGDRLAVNAQPQSALVLVPAQLPCGLPMARRDRLPPMGIAGQLCQGGRRRQMAPRVRPFCRRPAHRALPQPPAPMPWPLARHPPAAHRRNLLAQPAVGAMAPTDRPPRPAVSHQVTASWPCPAVPRVPASWRATPPEAWPGVGTPGSSNTEPHRPRSPRQASGLTCPTTPSRTAPPGSHPDKDG
jgi:hypothetical protein